VRDRLTVKQGDCDFVNLWGSHLYNPEDMPESIFDKFPNSYTVFRNKTKDVGVRPVLASPVQGQLPLPAGGSLPEAAQAALKFTPDLVDHFGFSVAEATKKTDPRACMEFLGGEEAGLKRVEDYFFTSKSLETYKDTRNGMIGANYSSKISPWLANGCLSIRQVLVKLEEFETKIKKNASTKHFVDELFWRDWFRYYCMAHEDGVFREYGPSGRSQSKWTANKDLINRWKQGTTGMPIVDAFMRELNETGWMGNRGRQIVASYLTLDLKQDWRYGAHHFEETLLDHDVQSNYGSWNASSGINGGRINNFNTLLQSSRFDPDGEFIRIWCPELAQVPNNYIHDPWNMPKGLQKMLKLELGG